MDEKLVTVATYRFLAEAEMARMHLADEGIQAFIADGQTITMDWFLGNALGYIKLEVAESQAQRAMAIMAKWPKPRMGADLAASDLEPLRCLACGKRMLEDQERCFECGWSYADASADDGDVGDSKPAQDNLDEVVSVDEELEAPETRIQGERPRRQAKEDFESDNSGPAFDEGGDDFDEAEPAEDVTENPDTRIQRDRPRPKRPNI
jgi:hypothetical protein